MNETDLSRAEWHKSSYSSQDGNCVEVATNLSGTVAIRDSQNRRGPTLAFNRHDWLTFVSRIKDE